LKTNDVRGKNSGDVRDTRGLERHSRGSGARILGISIGRDRRRTHTSGDSMDNWNHYGGIALFDGIIHVSSYDARLFAFGLKE
jgi:hypothetical protein